MTYDKCREKYIDKIMKEFENKKLKQRDGKIIKDRKQAIAIALGLAQKSCRYSTKDIKEIEKKLSTFLLDDDRKISKSRIPLTNVIETRVFIEYLIKKKNTRLAKKYYKLLLLRIITAGKSGINVSKNIFEEIYKISEIL